MSDDRASLSDFRNRAARVLGAYPYLGSDWRFGTLLVDLANDTSDDFATGYDAGQEAIWEEIVCSVCGGNPRRVGCVRRLRGRFVPRVG